MYDVDAGGAGASELAVVDGKEVCVLRLTGVPVMTDRGFKQTAQARRDSCSC
jgi:hypothetical protein